MKLNVINKSDLPLVGMALALVGVPIGMYLNQFFPVVKWSPIIMIISFVLTIKWTFYQSIPYFFIPKPLFTATIYTSFLLITITNGNGFASTNFHYILFIIAFSFALTTHKNDVNYDFFPYVLQLTSLPCLLIGVIVCFMNMVIGDIAYYGHLENEHYALEPFSVAAGALTCMFSSLCIKRKTILEYLLFAIILLGGLYVLFSCEKRTPLFVFIVGILYRYYSELSLFQITKKRLFFIAFGMLLFFTTYFFIPFISNCVDKFFFEMYAGILNLFGNTSVYDTTGSAIMRAENRKIAYEYINTHMEWIDYFVGVGYNKIGQIDNPTIQLFIETGIFGVIGYISLIIAYPLLIIKKRISNSSVILCILLSLYAMLSIINSGSPYIYNKYTPICILMAVVCHYKNRGKNV